MMTQQNTIETIDCLFFTLNTHDIRGGGRVFSIIHSYCVNECMEGHEPYERAMVGFTNIPNHNYSYILVPGVKISSTRIQAVRQGIQEKLYQSGSVNFRVLVNDSMTLSDVWKDAKQCIVKPESKNRLITMD